MITHRYLHGASVDERLVHWAYNQNTGAEVSERFYHRDHQGSIIAMSDASGNRPAGELYTYDAYGNMVTGTTSGQPFRYTGRRWDDETGLYYYRARYYSAQLGRFLQTDPIGYEDNMNLYGYVGNDPVNKIDPTGLAGECTTGSRIDGGGQSVPCSGGLSDDGSSGDTESSNSVKTAVLQSDSAVNQPVITSEDSLPLDDGAVQDMTLSELQTIIEIYTGARLIVSGGKFLLAKAGEKGTQFLATSKLFRPGSVLNSGRFLRIGVGRSGSGSTFRVAGESLNRLPKRIQDLLGVKQTPKGPKIDFDIFPTK